MMTETQEASARQDAIEVEHAGLFVTVIAVTLAAIAGCTLSNEIAVASLTLSGCGAAVFARSFWRPSP